MSERRTTGVHRIREYATSEQGRGHARVGGLGALAGAVAVMIPTLPALWTDHEERDEAAEALSLCHGQLESQSKAYTALVDQMAKFALSRRP